MLNKQFKTFSLMAMAAYAWANESFWGKKKDTSFNRMFGSVFPGHSPKGPSQDRPSGWLVGYRKKRDKLNRIAFESRRKNWR